MDNIAKTLYIPLYGKALVSRKGDDSKAENAVWITGSDVSDMALSTVYMNTKKSPPKQ